MVGALQYFTLTRPEISFSMNKFCQFLQQPTMHHWIVAKCLLRYLKCTFTHGLMLLRSTSLSLTAYTNANWTSNSHDRRSTYGYCIYLWHSLMSWHLGQQKIVSRSSTETEFYALANAVWASMDTKSVGSIESFLDWSTYCILWSCEWRTLDNASCFPSRM